MARSKSKQKRKRHARAIQRKGRLERRKSARAQARRS